MDLTLMQIFSQNAILLSLYPGLSIEEIFKKDNDLILSLLSEYGEVYLYDKYYKEYIQIPPTLPRVLEALGKGYFIENGFFCETYDTIRGKRIRIICKRKLLNEDKTDATLRDQSPETQTAIAKLLGREE